MPYKQYVLSPTAERGIVTSRTAQNLKQYADSYVSLLNFVLKDGSFELRPGDKVGSAAGFSGALASATGPVWGVYYYNAIDPLSAAATPVTTLLVHAGEATDGTGTSTLYASGIGVITVNGNNFTTTAPSDIFFLTVKNRCFVTARAMGTGVVPTVINLYPAAFKGSSQWGVYGPTADLSYDAYTSATNAFTLVYYQSGGAGVTSGSTSVTKISGTWDGGTAWAGKTAYLNDVPYTIVSYTPTTGPMVISPAWVDDGSGPHVNLRVQYGEISWPNGGPQYAYAYYSTKTGHISNVSPVLTVSEQSQQNVRVKLSNIMLTNDARYDRVVIFRTALANGGVLLPLLLDTSGTNPGSASVDGNVGTAGYGMIFNTSVGAVTYVDFQSDSFLGEILGPLPAPFTNDPPPADSKFLAYWDQRVWTVSAASPSRLYYSGNSAQIQLGVPEECFPALNFSDTTTDDGAITGIKVVGTNLLVGTNKNLLSASWNGVGYQLDRVSSRGSGVDQYAIDEHPGDSSVQSASAIYVSRDRRMWRQFPGGQVDDIGWPIQDKLDQIDLNKPKPVIVKVFQVGKVCMLACGIRKPSTSAYEYFFYDFDEKTWHDLGFAFGLTDVDGGFPSGWTDVMWNGVTAGIDYTSNVNGIPTFTIGDNGSFHLFSLMSDLTSGQASGGYIKTHYMDFGDKEAKKTLQELVLYVDDASQTWGAYANFDDAESQIPLIVQVDANTPRYMGTGTVRFKLPSKSAGTVVQSSFRSCQIIVTLGATAPIGTRLNKMVMNYSVVSTGAAGAHS